MIEGKKTILVTTDYKLDVDLATLELVSTVSANDLAEEISRRVVQLEDNAIIESLLEMGWTQPEKEDVV